MTIAPEQTAGLVVPEGHVKLVIDGIEVVAPKGELLIRTAERLGVVIPRFCDHPLLEPAGACRQCLVEVEMGGRPMPKPQASCTMTVADGMVVKTQLTSPVADKAQQGVMELLLINHPLDCPMCDKGGECPLQNQAMKHGRSDSRFHEQKRTFPKPIAVSSQVLLDRERCVLCQRCTRFSKEISGDANFLDLLERGSQQQVGTTTTAAISGVVEEPNLSYFSGNTIQICPVGALTSAAYRFRARPFDLGSSPSICEHCSSGCAQRTDFRRGKVQRRLARNEPEVNEEWQCDKGQFAFRYTTAADRITRPMIRDTETGELRDSSWTEALRFAAAGLAKARDARGVGVLAGGRLTVEDAYAYSKFARVALHTNDVDFRARPHSREELDFLTHAVLGSTPENGVTYQDIEQAPAALLVAFEPEEESPIVFLRLRKAARNNKSKIFHLGQYTTPAVTKTLGTLLPCVPGTEPTVLDSLPELQPEILTELEKPGAVILIGERAAETPGLFTAVNSLVERTGAKLAWVPRRAGERGALEAGLLPHLLPGGRLVTDSQARADVERKWGLAEGVLPSAPGRDTSEILVATASGALDALVVGGVDPFDLPDPTLAERALSHAGFVVSLELRHSAVTAHADVVFPVAATVEKAGSYLNWEGRSRPFDVTLAETNNLSDGRVLDTLAVEMDADLFTQTPTAAAADFDRLGRSSVRPAHEVASVPPATAVELDSGQAVLATWRRLLDNGSLQSNEPNLAGTQRPTVAMLSQATAARLNIEFGADITVSTPRGSITVPAAEADAPDGVVWLPGNSGPVSVRATLVAGHGSVITVSQSPGQRSAEREMVV